MSIDLKIAAGKSSARLTINIDKVAYTLAFKTGGITEPPAKLRATAGGGVVHENAYEHWKVSGTVTVSKDMAKWLLKAYHDRQNASRFSGVYELYSTADNMLIKHTFNNVSVYQLPHLNIPELGGEVTMAVSFSLNDYVGTQIIDG